MKVEKIVDKYYRLMFQELMDEVGDDLYEFMIEVGTARDGKTVRISWLERNKMLNEMMEV